MTRCIVHIGMHKTGSTSIQKSLHCFSNERFAYADLDGNPNHIWALLTLFTNHQAHHPRKSRDTSSVAEYGNEVRANLQRSIRALRGRTLIISAEGISTQLDRDGLVAMQEYLRPYFDEISIVGYVRPPAALMASGFQARLKARLDTRFNVAGMYPNYRMVFNKFDEVFGREHVHLWKFDPGNFAEGCAVRDFCSRLGIDLPADRITRHNESIPRQAVRLLYTYGKFGEQYGSRTFASGERAKLVRSLRRVGKDKFRFSPDLIRPVLEKNRADIEWMEARLGQSLREELEHQPGDVRDASDFLTPDPEGVSNLLSLLGDQAPPGVTGKTVEEVVWLVHLLRRTLTSAPDSQEERADSARPVSGRIRLGNSRKTRMNVAELTAEIQKTNVPLLDVIPQNKAEALVSSVFQHIKATLAGKEGGMVSYEGLGRFRVRKAGKAGRKVTRTAIRFRMAEGGRRRP